MPLSRTNENMAPAPDAGYASFASQVPQSVIATGNEALSKRVSREQLRSPAADKEPTQLVADAALFAKARRQDPQMTGRKSSFKAVRPTLPNKIAAQVSFWSSRLVDTLENAMKRGRTPGDKETS